MPLSNPQSEIKHGQVHHQYTGSDSEIQLQLDSNPALSIASQMATDMQLSDH